MLRIRTTLSGWSGGPGVFTTYYETPLEDSDAVVRCRQYVHDLIGGCLAAVLSNQVTWEVQSDVDVVTAASGAVTNTISDATAHTNTGGGGVDMGPTASAALVRWNTAVWVAGRHIQGRSFLGPIAEAIVMSTGQVDATIQAARNAALVTYLASLDSGDSQVVWHRPKGGSGGSIAVITSGEVRTKLAVLTSRRD